MLKREYIGQELCSVARTLEIIGDRWTWLIIRDAFLGISRFGEFEESLGVAPNVLHGRLDRLVGEGIFERKAYSEHPARHEYRLTQKGDDLFTALNALRQWGDQYVCTEADAAPAREGQREAGRRGARSRRNPCLDQRRGRARARAGIPPQLACRRANRSGAWPDAWPDETVWSAFGRGYGFAPLILPIAAIVALQPRRARSAARQPHPVAAPAVADHRDDGLREVRAADPGGTHPAAAPSLPSSRGQPTTDERLQHVRAGYHAATVNWLIFTPLIVLGVLLLLFGVMLLLGRVAGGRYLHPIVRGLSKVPFLKRLFERMSTRCARTGEP